MARLCQRGLELLKEVAECEPESIPPFNNAGVQEVLREVEQHAARIEIVYKEALQATLARHDEQQQQLQPEGGTEREPSSAPPVRPDWQQFAPQAATVMTHIKCIQRCKRQLLVYIDTRFGMLTKLRRSILSKEPPDTIQQNLSPLEVEAFQQYSQLLSQYQQSVGFNINLWQEGSRPPHTALVNVEVLKDAGEFAFPPSFSAKLVKGDEIQIPADAVPSLRSQRIVTPKKKMR